MPSMHIENRSSAFLADVAVASVVE